MVFVSPAIAHLLLRGRFLEPVIPIVITPTPASRYIGDLIEQTDGDYLDWLIDWSALGLGADTITTSRWSVSDTELDLSMPSSTATTTTIWITGGEQDGVYTITNTITTSGGKTLQKRFDCLIDP